MSPDKIRDILRNEADRLKSDFSRPYLCGHMLWEFANVATDAELLRLRQIISGLSPAELNDAARGQ